VNGARHGGRGRRSEQPRDQRVGVVATETAERDPFARRGARERPQELGDRGRALALDVAAGRDQQERRVGDLGREQAEQAERRRVGPMDVVEQDHERLPFGRAFQDRRDAVEEPETRRLALGRTVARLTSSELRHERYDLGGDRRLGGQPGRHLGQTRDRPQHLHPRPERRRGVALVGSTGQHGEPAPARARREHLGAPGLADAGLAEEHDRASASGDGFGERRVQVRDEIGTPDEGGVGRVGERPDRGRDVRTGAARRSRTAATRR
jgi:hypothetical protein